MMEGPWQWDSKMVRERGGATHRGNWRGEWERLKEEGLRLR
jgi:hypothetical protein